MLTPRLAVGSRAVNNSRIVVLGGGDTALGALEAVFAAAAEEGCRFPHLTLLAPCGLPVARDPYSLPAPFSPGRDFSGFELARLPFSAHVAVVAGCASAINRGERSVVLGGKYEVRMCVYSVISALKNSFQFNL